MPRVQRQIESPLAPGTHVGRYVIADVLGQGGMGIVYAARDTELDRDVALKCPCLALAADSNGRRRFLREARAAARLSSPYIVAVHEVFEAHDRPWIASELVDGPTLATALRRAGGPLPIRDVVRTGGQIAEALHVAHSNKILHRDVKPGNVLLASDGRACLTDFGLAASWLPTGREETATTESAPLTTNGVVGTPAYMSPEQVLGRHLDARSDLFALGAVLYESCTGDRAFKATDDSSLHDAILHHEPTAIARLNYEVPGELERIVRKALAKDPDERYASAQDLAVDLRALRRHLEAPGPERAPPRVRRAGRIVIGIAAAALAGIALVLVSRWSWRGEPALPFDGDRPPVVRPFVTWPSQEWEGRFSPDGRWISFISSRDGVENVWIKARDGESTTRISDETDPVIGHVWSPDGTRIAYAVRRSADLRLVLVDAPLAGNRRLLVETAKIVGGWPRLLRWGDDGIVVQGARGIWRVDAETGALSNIAVDRSCCERAFEYAMRGDGARLAFVGVSDGRQDIWASDVDGGHAVRVTDDAIADDSPIWLGRSANRLVYRSHHTGQFDLWLTDLDHRVTHQVPFAGYVAALGDASPAGDAFTVRVQQQSVALWRLDGRSGRTVRLGGDQLGELVPSLGAKSDIIAFQRARPKLDISFSALGSHVYIASLGTSGLTDVRLAVENGFSPAVSPHGSYVAYLTTDPDEDFVVDAAVYEVATGRSFPIASRVSFPGYRPVPLVYLSDPLVWHPTDPALYYVTHDDGAATLHRFTADPAGGKTERIVDVGGDGEEVMQIALTGDGSTVGLVVSGRTFADQRLIVVDPAAHESRVVPLDDQISRGRVLRLLGWDGGSLILAALRSRPDLSHDISISRISPGGDAETIGAVGDAIGETARLDVSGRRVLATATRGGADNLIAMDLDTGAERALTDVTLGSTTTIGAAVPIAGGDVIFTRQEDQVDVWLVESR